MNSYKENEEGWLPEAKVGMWRGRPSGVVDQKVQSFRWTRVGFEIYCTVG
jgi:hypothetical protein